MLLQLAKLNAKEITKIVDVNPYKFGRITPVSNIEIAKERIKFKKNKVRSFVDLALKKSFFKKD